MRQKQGVFSLFLLSPSSRRAWIEIRMSSGVPGPISVALLAEGVDRNHQDDLEDLIQQVALLAEGVDRNIMSEFRSRSLASPSSRRAWIEIERDPAAAYICILSPSSRRAWIEINDPS